MLAEVDPRHRAASTRRRRPRSRTAGRGGRGPRRPCTAHRLRPRVRPRRRRSPGTRRLPVSVTAGGARRGSAGRAPRGRDEVADHEAHRLTDRRSRGEAAGRVLEQRGPGEERLDEPAHEVLRPDPRASPGRSRRARPASPPRCRRSRRAASSAERSARWRPSPVNGSRNPAASPTSSQPSPARRDDPGPTAPRPRSRRSVRGAATSTGIVVGRRDGASTASRRRPRPSRRSRSRQRRPPARCRRSPGRREPARGRRSRRRTRSSARRGRVRLRVRDVERQRRSRRAAPGRATPAVARHDRRSPSAPTTTRGRDRRRRPRRPRPVRDGRTLAPVRTSAPAARARSSSSGSSVDRSSPTAGDPTEPSSPYVRRNRVPAGVSTRIAGIGRRRGKLAVVKPGARSAATVAGDVNTPQARHRHAGARSRTTTSRPRLARRPLATAPGRAAADDDDVGCSTTDDPVSARRSRRGGRANPTNVATGVSPASRSRPRISARV